MTYCSMHSHTHTHTHYTHIQTVEVLASSAAELRCRGLGFPQLFFYVSWASSMHSEIMQQGTAAGERRGRAVGYRGSPVRHASGQTEASHSPLNVCQQLSPCRCRGKINKKKQQRGQGEKTEPQHKFKQIFACHMWRLRQLLSSDDADADSGSSIRRDLKLLG